jgi:hypothetical protein
MKKIALAVILIGAAYFIYACGDVQNSVNGKVVSGLAVSPTSAALTTGSNEAFYANATFTDGSTGPVEPTWSVTNKLGTIISVGYAGILMATNGGTGEMIAAAGGLTAVATVTVTVGPTPEPGGLASIEVSPPTLDMPVGGLQTFTATGRTAAGESVIISPSWSISGAAVGSFESSGVTATLEATAVGHAVISCISGGISTTVPVTIEGAIVSITVEADTYVDELTPTTPHEGETLLKVGYLTASPGQHFETYLRFSLASLPAGIISIEAVQLEVFPSSADSPSFQLFVLNSAFSATTDWTTRPVYGTFIQSTTFTTSQYSSITSSALLNAVRAWYANPASNFGLAIKQDGGSNGTVTLLSKENGTNQPILGIVYK